MAVSTWSQKKNESVYAPFPGRLVAARMGAPSAVGSTNFVLIRHDMTVGNASVRFFSLYFHLRNDTKALDKAKQPDWMATKTWKASPARRMSSPQERVVLLNEPVEAGSIIGHAGEAGPSGERQSQIHLEIFAANEVMKKIDPGPRWTVVDGSISGRFSTSPEVNGPIDQSNDKMLSRRELINFFSSDNKRAFLRSFAVLHVSEWFEKPDWAGALRNAPDFRSTMTPAEIQDLVDEQISPTLWWTKRVAKHAMLPPDGVVYHYNPITFIKIVNERLLEANAQVDVGLGAFRAAEAKETPKGVTDDREDESGESFFDEEELKVGDDSEQWDVERLRKGFPGP